VTDAMTGAMTGGLGVCAWLPLFVDGELAPEELPTFSRHLTSCPRCPAALGELLVLDDLVAEVEASAGQTAPARRRAPLGRRKFVAAAGVALTGAAAAFFVLGPRAPHSDSLLLAIADTPYRSQMARWSRAAADRYRPFNPARAVGAVGTAQAPAEVSRLAAIEESGDAGALAAAYFLLGLPAQAEAHLPPEDGSADALNDRAAIFLERGQIDTADALLARALLLAPGHRQARWNRALVLRARGDRSAAARVFEELAQEDQGGWADEARGHARDLRP
jgi:tetratricopeptide (TPR) repeat protein